MVDIVEKEQFIEILPEEVKVWVKEYKPGTSGQPSRGLQIGQKEGAYEELQVQGDYEML